MKRFETVSDTVLADSAASRPLAGSVRSVAQRMALAIALLGLILAYGDTLRTLASVWRHNPNYSHGFLIPPIAAWLFWRQRRAFAEAPPGGSWWGLLLLIPAVLLQLVGIRGNVVTLQGASFVLAVAGVTGQIYGPRALGRLAFPIAFLLFMIPALPGFMHAASFKLKIFAAQGAVAIAHAMSVSVQRDGVNLLFPDGVLAVENACAGLRSLVALMALGALFAYLSTGRLISRAVLFALALPIAVLANMLRIGSLCVYAGMAGPSRAAGAFHDIGGYALFAIAFVLLAGARRLLRC